MSENPGEIGEQPSFLRVQPPVQAIVRQLRGIFDLESSGRLLVYSVVVGVVAGLGAAAFHTATEAFQGFALGRIAGYVPPPAGEEGQGTVVQPRLPDRWWAVLAVPTAGGLICGWLVQRFAPEAEGDGTDGMIRAFHHRKGEIPARIPIWKAVASVITIGSGGSAGREGPISQIGAGFGALVADRLRLSDQQRRVLVLAGAAGGLGAIFRAPLGGSLFAVEVLYATTAFEFAAIIPCVCSSVVAYSVFAAIYGQGFAFATPRHLAFGGAHQLPFYVVFAVVCALVGFLYVWVFFAARDRLFRPMPIPKFLKPAVGGLMLGVVALVCPQVMAGGYGWIQQAIDGQLALGLMGALVLAKILATSVTVSSGGSGGVFAPSLFIGAMLGGAYGLACQQFFPDLAPPPAACVLVGMGGFFAGVAKVPLTALIMVSEMSGSYGLLVPLMLVSMVNVAVLSQRWSLYEEQVPSLIDSPAHLGEFVVDVLAGMAVHEVYYLGRHVSRIPEDMPLPKVLELVAGSSESYYPVVDRDGRMVGMLSLSDLRSALVGNRAGNLVLAVDLANADVPTITPNASLLDALRLFVERQVEELPVVDPQDSRKVVCMLRRQEVIGAYDRRMAALRGVAAAE